MSIGHKWFGKRAAVVLGLDKWAAHDASKTWSDGGAVAEAVTESNKTLISQLEKIVADNATAGVSEYLSDAEIGVRADQTGEVIVGLRIANDQAVMIVEIPLRKLVVGALSEMRPTLGVDPQAQAVLSALISLGNNLSSLAGKPVPPPLPALHAAVKNGRVPSAPNRAADELATSKRWAG